MGAGVAGPGSGAGHELPDEPDRRRGATGPSAGILAGPNIAREVADGYAAAVLAMPDQRLAANLGNLFRTRRFRTYTTDDVVGVEMAGALKNVYAIAVGMGYSLGIGRTRARW